MGAASSPVQVRVLGPLRVLDGEHRDLTPSGALQRRLLAMLVLRRGSMVPMDVLIEVLWPSERPADPAAAVQNHASRLRRVLPEGTLESTGDAYRLDHSKVDVDAHRLEEAAREPSAASSDDLGVLTGWAGPAYPDLDDVDGGRTEALRLEDLRITLEESHAERRLRVGDDHGLVSDLRALTERDPLRERPRELLMEALSATGRTAEALRTYDDFRRLLGAELGIDPSPSLSARHAQLLAGSGGPDHAEGSSRAPTSRLPAATTSLIGRDELAEEVTALAESQRLVVLVGPGGVGKTRLMVEVGQRLLDHDQDRPVVMCELTAATHESAVGVVAAAMGIDARPGTRSTERVIGVVGHREIVLLVDNCEHVVEPIAELVDRVLRCVRAR